MQIDLVSILITLFLFIVTQLITAAAIWGGLKAEIKFIHAKFESVEKSIVNVKLYAAERSSASDVSALSAHQRIDTIMELKRHG